MENLLKVIKEGDVVLVGDKEYYQVKMISHLYLPETQNIRKRTLVLDYNDCGDGYYNWVDTLEDRIDEVKAVYRHIDGELKLIYKE